jgi:hypothetical protein
VAFGHFNNERQRTLLTKAGMDLSERLAKQDGGDFLHGVAGRFRSIQ